MHSTNTTTKDGRQVVQSVLWVRLVSKTAAMTLACKYGLTERHSVESKVEVDLAAILGSIPAGPVEDEVEQRIDEALGQPAAEAPANRLECRPSRNGAGHANYVKLDPEKATSQTAALDPASQLRSRM